MGHYNHTKVLLEELVNLRKKRLARAVSAGDSVSDDEKDLLEIDWIEAKIRLVDFVGDDGA